MSPFLISIAFFFLIGAAAIALYLAVFGGRQVEERFADLAVKMRLAQGSIEDGDIDTGLGRMIFRWAVKRLPPPNRDSPQGEKLSQTLVQAGFLKSSAAQTYQVLRIFAAAGTGALGLVIGLILHGSASQPLLFAVMGAGIGLFVPSYILGRRARIRQGAISRQLSDVLDLLVVCVEAGLGLYEAIRIVGTECERQGQEIGTELSLVASDISAGASLGQALRGLADRTAVDDIKPLAATLIQSEQLGAQIAPALKASSDALRTRRRLRAEEQAQKASIKILFPLVLMVLPSMIALIVGPAILQIFKTLSTSA
jgi:tight adherence protein C